jgi:zinc protease
MNYNLKKFESYSLASITEKKSDLAVAYLTIDIHDNNSVASQALQLVYSEALLSGAGSLSREEFLDSVNKLGATISISISDGKLNIILKGLKANFPQLLSLFKLIITEPSFENSEVARIKKTTVNELHEAKEDSKHIAASELVNIFYGSGDRKYTHDIDKLIKEVSLIKKPNLVSLHKAVMGQVWICSIASDAKTISNFNTIISKLKAASPKAKPFLSLHQQKPPLNTVTFKDLPSKSNIDINIGAPIPITLHHPDYLALSFAITVLAKWGGFSGRLMSTVREKEGLTYMIYGRPEGFTSDEQGYWRIVTFFAPDKAVTGITSTLREIDNLYKKGVTVVEFNKFKTIFKTQQTLLNDSVYKLLSDLHSFHCQNFTLDEIKEFKDKINSVTLLEVNAAVKNYLHPKNLSISCAGPIAKVKKDIVQVIK